MIMVGGLGRWVKCAVMGEMLSVVRRPRSVRRVFVAPVLPLGRLLSVWAPALRLGGPLSVWARSVLRLGLIRFPAVPNPVSVWGTSSL
jgi:hypothetical protein